MRDLSLLKVLRGTLFVAAVGVYRKPAEVLSLVVASHADLCCSGWWKRRYAFEQDSTLRKGWGKRRFSLREPLSAKAERRSIGQELKAAWG